MAGFSPRGHGKIEIKGLKGSLSISLENAEEDQFYSVMVVDRGKEFELGKVYTERNGKGREELTFNISDLEASGFSVDKLNGIVIKRGKDVLLGGYLDKEDGSLENYIKSLLVKEEPVVRKEAVELKAEEPEPIEEAYMEESIEPAVENFYVEAEEIPENFDVEVEQVPEIFDVEAEAVEEVPEAVEEVLQVAEVEEIEIESIDAEDTFEALESVEIDIEVNQFIEMEAGEDFEAEFEPVMELSQEPEIEAIEPDVIEPEEIEPEEIELEGIEPEKIAMEFEPIEEYGSAAVEFGAEFEPINPEDFETEAVELGAVEIEIEPEVAAIEPEPVAEEVEPLIEYEESNEEVIEIKNMDYEQNRRIIQRNQTTSYILNILRYFPHVDPLRINLNGYSWWRIDYQDEEKGFLPYFSYVVNNEQRYGRQNHIATAKDLMSSYGHYLFGLYDSGNEVKYYVYAVPGAFYRDEQPHSGVTGFNTWFPGNEISGYWLLYIDALTGKVIYPINPMIPTE